MVIFMLLIVSCSTPVNNAGIPEVPTQVLQSPTPTITPTPQPKARVLLGEKDLLYGDYDAAYDKFLTSKNESNDPEVITAAQLGLGRALLLKKDYRGAVDQFSWLLSNYREGDSRNTAYFFLAQAYEGLTQPRLAADAYANYLAAIPGPLDSEINEMMGDNLLQAGDPIAAKIAFERALLTSPSANRDALQIKVAQSASESGDDAGAISIYLALYDSSSSDYIKAQANFLLGQIYLRLGENEQAYSRFQDSVNLFPTYYDTFSGLVVLVEAGLPVDERQRGIIDYYAGQYGMADAAFDRYISANPDHDGTTHYYKALSLYKMGKYEAEVAEWDKLIKDHPTDPKYPAAFLEKASTQWDKLQQYDAAAQTLLTFVALVPTSPDSPDYLYRAARIYEIGGYLTNAAKTWERVFNEYPGSEDAYPGLFEAGVIYFRLNDFQKAQITFQRLLVLATNPEEQAAANLWIAKSLEKQEKNEEARAYFQQSINADPSGYYSIRAAQILNRQAPFPAALNVDLAVDLSIEKTEADRWMRETFKLDAAIDLASPAELASNPLFQRAETFAKLGMRNRARGEYEALQKELQADAINTYRLMNRLVELGFYQSAVLSSRQVLDLAGLSQSATLTSAPKYFNHIRFGAFFREIIVPAAVEHNLDPLLLFSIIRQESLFETDIISSEDARGLMQILPTTGEEIAAGYNWPPNFTPDDLNRAFINVRLGTHYFKKWIDYFNGDIVAALAAYNGGIGNTLAWTEIAGGDPDLLLEVIRADETRGYIRSITENYEIYKSFYSHP
jgi:soluble lytic murein transglycosylase